MKFVCLKYPRLEMTYKPDRKKEIDGEILKVPREIIKFEGGYYETNDAGQIAFIKKHVDFGNGNICVVEAEEIQSPEPETVVHKKGRPKKEV